MRWRLLDRVAQSLAARGIREIALFGAGRHTRPIVRQPWCAYGIRVVLILDDAPALEALGNVTISRPNASTLPDSVGALVISSEHYEDKLYQRAHEVYGHLDKPIVRIYNEQPLSKDAELLVRQHGISESDAAWLIENRGERHDATLPMLPRERTELHLRRYELARDVLRNTAGRSVADLASGTGYGAQMLADQPELTYVGLDIDARAVDYATRRFGNAHRDFRCASVTDTGLPDASFDLVASFETIEHVENTQAIVSEYSRVIRENGVLIVSTPNRLGPTPFHVHDFDFPQLAAALEPHFEIQDLIGQLSNDTVYDPALPPGMWFIDIHSMDSECVGREGRRPEYLILLARHRGALGVRPLGVIDEDTQTLRTRHGLMHLFCPNDTVRWRAQTLLTKEPETIDWIEKFEPGDVYWDIGASTGPYVMYAAAAGRANMIYAFEPSPWNWWVLAEQIRRSGLGKNVVAFPLAIGSESQAGRLHMRHPMPGGAGSSFGEPRGEHGEAFTASFEQGAISISIDDLVDRFGLRCPNQLKIDVDGNEIEVIRGGLRTIANPVVRSVLVELDAARKELVSEVNTIMNRAGLHLEADHQSTPAPRSVSTSICNFVFRRSGD